MEWFTENTVSALLALVVTVSGGLIVQWLQPKVKLQWSETHQFVFFIKEGVPNPFRVFTKTVVIKNFGRALANNVEVLLNAKPKNLNFWPPTEFKSTSVPENYVAITIPKIRPKEHFTLEFLEMVQVPEILSVKSDECIATAFPSLPVRIFPPWVIRFIYLTMAIGVASVLYWVFKFGIRFFGLLN